MSNQRQILEAAIDACKLGIYPVPVETQHKRPAAFLGKKWQDLRITEKTAPRYFRNGYGLGWMDGIAPFHLADLDIDAPEAVAVARFIALPETARIFGHASKRTSHFMYQVAAKFKSKSFKDPIKDKKSGTLVEVFGAGHQTVVPSTTHPSNEPIEWEQRGAFGQTTIDELLRCAGKIAGAALLVRYSAGGHEQTMALAGMLCRAGYPEPETAELLNAVVRARKPERDDTYSIVRNTFDRVRAGENAHGFTRYCELVGAERGKLIADRIAKWLGLQAPARASVSRATHTERPAIVCNDRQLSDVTDDALKILHESNAPPALFVRDRRLARVAFDRKGRPVIEMVNERRIARETGFCCQLCARGPRTQGRQGHRLLPATRRRRERSGSGRVAVSTATQCHAIARGAGRWFNLSTAGYNPMSHMHYTPTPGFDMPVVPDKPTSGDLQVARAKIADALQDFPFVDDAKGREKVSASYANALGMFLTLVAYPAIEGHVPLALVDAPQAGTGKGLLADAACAVSTGNTVAVMPPPKDDEEWRKRILSCLLAGNTIMVVDNVERRLESLVLPHS